MKGFPAFWFHFYPHSFWEVVNEPASLTKETLLWQLVWHHFLEHPHDWQRIHLTEGNNMTSLITYSILSGEVKRWPGAESSEAETESMENGLLANSQGQSQVTLTSVCLTLTDDPNSLQHIWYPRNIDQVHFYIPTNIGRGSVFKWLTNGESWI